MERVVVDWVPERPAQRRRHREDKHLSSTKNDFLTRRFQRRELDVHRHLLRCNKFSPLSAGDCNSEFLMPISYEVPPPRRPCVRAEVSSMPTWSAPSLTALLSQAPPQDHDSRPVVQTGDGGAAAMDDDGDVAARGDDDGAGGRDDDDGAGWEEVTELDAASASSEAEAAIAAQAARGTWWGLILRVVGWAPSPSIAPVR